MEGHANGDEISGKMHPHIFDGESVNLYRVMKGVHENLYSISRIILACDHNLHQQHINTGLQEFPVEPVVKVCCFLISFFRSTLKYCVSFDAIINRSLVDVLIDVEAHLVAAARLLLSCARAASSADKDSWPSNQTFQELANIDNLVPKVAEFYPVVFSGTSSPFVFFTGPQSVEEFFSLAATSLVYCLDTEQPDGELVYTLSQKLFFLINYFLFIYDSISSESFPKFVFAAEVVVDMMACYSFVTYFCSSNQVYSQVKNLIELDVHIRILKVLAFQPDLCPPFTDELLINYGNCVRQSMIGLVENQAIDLTSQAKDQVNDLQYDLLFLVDLFVNYERKPQDTQEELSRIRILLQTVVMSVGSIIHLFANYDTKENKAAQVDSLLSDLRADATFVRDEVANLCLRDWRTSFNKMAYKIDVAPSQALTPSTDGSKDPSHVTSQTLEATTSGSKGPSHVTSQTLDATADGCKDPSHVTSQTLDATTDVIEDPSHVRSQTLNATADGNNDPIYRMTSQTLEATTDGSKDPSHLRFQTLDATTDGSKDPSHVTSQTLDATTDGSQDPSHMTSQTHDATTDGSKDASHVTSQSLVLRNDVFVGFELEMKLIWEQLACGPSHLDVVSITGMAGLGKTTLARKMYEDPHVARYFKFRAWCYVSQEYQRQELFLAVLGSIIELTDQIRRMNDEDLSVMVHKNLMGRRYLIVMDDIWGIEVYEDIKRFFPDDNCGSRVILTTRNKSIALKAKRHSEPLELRLLTDDESWDLLEQKIYFEERCPVELSQVGKKIAQRCGGLPLAVVLVAGALSKSDKKRDFWEQVSKSLILHIDSERQGMAALELSYNMLPDYLKPLFLYVGAFPEEKVILASQLMWVWIAEGFVESTELRSLEDQAEIHLKDLIDRSLLMVAETRSNGRVKSCRVHDLLRDVCLAKAKKENFMQHVHALGELPDRVIYEPRLSISLGSEHESSPTSSTAQEVPSSSYYPTPSTIPSHLEVQTRRQLWNYAACITSGRSTANKVHSSSCNPTLSITPSLHSVLFFSKKVMNLSTWEDAVKSILRTFELLRIFHFQGTILEEEICNDLMSLVNLRYIAILAPWTHIPAALCRLWSLETLFVKGARGEIVVPDAIWEMVKLRHLHIDSRASFNNPSDISFKLENLVTLSTPALQGNVKTMISSLPNLRKLRCIFLDPPDTFEFPELESLNLLESLKVAYHGSVRYFSLSNLPASLTKLSISKFQLQWKEVASFQNLPNLEVLKLRFRAVNGELWDMGEEDSGFLKLKYLKLESLNIKQWNAVPDNFPRLQKLVLQRCKQLEEIPALGEFYSLQNIEVLWCNSSVANLARSIQEEQEDEGNEFPKSYIYPPHLDLDSSA